MKFPAFDPIDLKNTPKDFEGMEIPLAQIMPDENQPRKIFDENALQELALSIKQHGVIQPIIVKKNNNDEYLIVAGERRWRAAKLAGLKKIPAIIREYDKSDRMAVALIENIQRENLNSLEEAQAIQRLLEECAMTHTQVAESIGRSRTAVSNLLRLLNLEHEVKDMINLGLLEMGHARALLSLFGQNQIDAAKHIVIKKLSVRETEKLVQQVNDKPKAKAIFVAPEFEKKAMDWKTSMSKQLSSKVSMNLDSNGKGKVVIFFNSIEEANWLMENLNVSGKVEPVV